ncbi:MAG: methyltransferase domain-containing protein [Magnetococcales bacterium]|nr:methyltransferase domain-containing protein [Magnetococcales bacterium]
MAETVIPFVKPTDHPDSKRLRQAWQKCGRQLTDPHTLITQVGAQLLVRLDEIKGEPKQILNFGGRSGLLTGQLRKKWPQSTVIAATYAESAAQHAAPYHGLLRRRRLPALVTDGKQFPFKRNQFDAVVSNMALHWSSNPGATLREMRRVLKPGGLFLISMPGSESLQELKSVLAQLDEKWWGKVWPRVAEMPDMHTFGDLLASCGFFQPIVDRDPIQAPFADTTTLIQGLKKLGAGNHHAKRLPGLTPKGYFTELSQLYQKQFGLADGQINVSMEILFGHGWKADPNRKEEQQAKSSPLPHRF